jgi:hypothetical protein
MLRTFPLSAPSAVPADTKPAKPNLIRRLFTAVLKSRQRRAEREIARYLAQSGFTDAAEREIERRFLYRPFI